MLDALLRPKVPSRAVMTRTILSALLFGVSVAVASPGCSDEGVGDPCTPEQEYNADFNGFDYKEVNVESKSFQCRTRVCLVNHFQGRVSCPYGQDSTGNAPDGAKPCTIPGTEDKITGNPNDTKNLALVKPQCIDRAAGRAVYCSCRCADINGQKPADQVFCDCPDGYTCTQLVTSIGQGNEGLTGAYCIQAGTAFDPVQGACTQGNCDPAAHKCD